MTRVTVAMSGGVDSTVAAAVLKDQGHEVNGITMLVRPGDSRSSRETDDAERNAVALGIPHKVVDFRDLFSERIIDLFCFEYSQGRTPNPCVQCNYYVKFGALLEYAAASGADYLATGHYARVEHHGDRYRLKRGIDFARDQSYFLYRLGQEKLRHALMPLGTMTKQQVRRIAEDMGLPASGTPDSQEICFIPDNDYATFVRSRIPGVAVPGPVISLTGELLGEHNGIINYTIGQRRGIGISAREPHYVIGINARQNTIIAGPKEAVYRQELIASMVNWVNGDSPRHPLRIEAKIRYTSDAAEAILTPLPDQQVHLRFDQPQIAIAPGQAVVFYEDDVVLGGGTIE